MALIGVLASGLVSLAFVKAMDLKLGYALGLFAGSGTSTPTLQAAIATLGNDDPAVGYSVSYPFGVAGPILLLYLAFMVLKAEDRGAARADGLEMLRLPCATQTCRARRSANVMTALPAGVQIVAHAPGGPERGGLTQLRGGGERRACSWSAPARTRSPQAGRSLGEAAPGRLVKDRGHLDYLRVFASPAHRGQGGRSAISNLPGEKASIIAHVRRGDTEHPCRAPDLVLEFGDRIGHPHQPRRFPATAAILRRLDQGAPPSSATSPLASAWRSDS